MIDSTPDLDETQIARRRLLVAAAERGLASLHVSEIARRAGCSAATVLEVLATPTKPLTPKRRAVLTVLGLVSGSEGQS